MLTFLMGCQKQPVSDEQILSDIFASLIDSLDVRFRTFPPIPPPPIFDMDSGINVVDTFDQEKALQEYQEYLGRLDSLDTRTIIGLIDARINIEWDYLKSGSYSQVAFVDDLIHENGNPGKTIPKWIPNQIATPDDYRIILKSQLIKDNSNKWAPYRHYKFAGYLGISSVYFTQDKKHGMLQVDYYYMPMPFDGFGNYVLIEKVNNKWRIIRLLESWVS